MAFWKYGVFNGLLAGAIWGSIWQLITNIALIVSSGISIRFTDWTCIIQWPCHRAFCY